jgi:HPt (histidine-containing phosphotransfer) domain-containing protein
MDAYVVKPINARAFVELVESLALKGKPLPDEQSADDGGRGVEVHTSEPGQPVLDLAAALERLGGDRKLFEDMTRFFREDAPGLVNRIRVGIEQNDGPTVVLAAHSLKGIAAACGGVRVASAASELEKAARDENFMALKMSLPKLELALANLEDALPQPQASLQAR